MIALWSVAPPLKQLFYIKAIGFSDVILFCILQLIFDFKHFMPSNRYFWPILTKKSKFAKFYAAVSIFTKNGLFG